MSHLLAAFTALLCGLAIASAPAFADNRIAVLPDGKILVAGGTSFGFGTLARLEPDGDLDPTFGDGGVVIDRTSSPFTDLLVQPDGKILVLGTVSRLRRFETDGSLDLEFGEGGVAVRGASTLLDPPVALALLPDGRIALGGNYHVKMTTHQALAVVYARDGKSVEQVGKIGPPQSSYVPGSTNLAGTLTALAPWRDETLLMAGSSAPDFNSSEGGGYVFARFVPGAGSPYDLDFGAGAGLVRIPFSFNALAPVPGGVYGTGTVSDHIVLARFSEEGALDGSFGVAGSAEVSPSSDFSQGNDLVAGADGKVVVAGEDVSKEGRTGRSCRGCRHPLLVRFLADGSLDPSFGGGGVTEITGTDGASVRAMGETVVALPDGRLLIGGAATSNKPRVLVSMVLANGQVDRGFGDGGIAAVDPCPGTAAAQRRAGCLPAARASLRVRRGPRRRFALRLRIRSNREWAPLTGVHVTLPRQLRTIKDRGRKIEVKLIERDGSRRSSGVGVTSRRLGGYWSVGLRSLSIAVPAGVLKRVVETSPGARLPFRVKVRFGSPFVGYPGSGQLVVLRRALG